MKFNLSKNKRESEVSRLESRHADRLTIHGGLMRARGQVDGTKTDGLHRLILLTGINNTSHLDSHFL